MQDGIVRFCKLEDAEHVRTFVQRLKAEGPEDFKHVMCRPVDDYRRAAADLALLVYEESGSILAVAGVFEVGSGPDYLEFGGVAADPARWGLGLQMIFTGVRVLKARLTYPGIPHATVIAPDNAASLRNWSRLASPWADPPESLYEECQSCDKLKSLPTETKCCSSAFALSDVQELEICRSFLLRLYPEPPDDWDTSFAEDEDPLLAAPALTKEKDGKTYRIEVDCREVRDQDYLGAIIEQLEPPLWSE